MAGCVGLRRIVDEQTFVPRCRHHGTVMSDTPFKKAVAMIVSKWLESVRARFTSRLRNRRISQRRKQPANQFGTTEQLEVRSMLSAEGLSVTAIKHHQHAVTGQAPVREAGRDEATEHAKKSKGSTPTHPTTPLSVTPSGTTASSHHATTKPANAPKTSAGRGGTAVPKPGAQSTLVIPNVPDEEPDKNQQEADRLNQQLQNRPSRTAAS